MRGEEFAKGVVMDRNDDGDGGDDVGREGRAKVCPSMTSYE